MIVHLPLLAIRLWGTHEGKVKYHGLSCLQEPYLAEIQRRCGGGAEYLGNEGGGAFEMQ